MSATEHTDLGVPGIGPGVLIGAGGTAQVYRARQDALDRTVAVKILGPLDEAGRRRFDRERRAMGRLSAHRGIVTVYEAGVNNVGQSYVVMPLMEQGSLQDLVDRGTVDWRVAAKMLSDISATIADAHDMSILHRDLKPGNVLLDDQGNPQVADFGLAHIVDSATAHKSTQLAFTPGFVPPETLEGLPATPAGDVYSLGATLFALLDGRAPFVSESADGNILALALRVRDEPVPDLRHRGVPDGLCAVLEASMDKNPAARPTAREFSLRLAELAAAGGVDPHAAVATVPEGIQPEPPLLVGGGAASGESPLPIVPSPSSGSGGSRGPLVAVVGIAAVVVAAIVGFVVLGGGDDADPDADATGEDVGVDDGAADDGQSDADGGAAADGGDGNDDTAVADDTAPADDGGAGDAPAGDDTAADDGVAGDGTVGGDGAGADDGGPGDDGAVGGPTPVLDPMVTATYPASIDARFPFATDDGLFLVDPVIGQVARLDLDTGDERVMDVGARPAPLEMAEGLIWVSNRGDGTITVIDPADAAVVTTVISDEGVNTIGSHEGLVYAPNGGAGTVTVIDGVTLAPIATVEVGNDPFTPGYFDGTMWVPNRDDATVSLIDPDSLAVVGEVPVPAGPGRPEILFGRLWVIGSDAGSVAVFDPGSLEPAATVELAADLRPPVAAGGLVWITGPSAERVWAIDPVTATIVHTVPLPSGSEVRPAQSGFGSVWLAFAGLDQVRSIDPISGSFSHTIRVGGEPAVVQVTDEVVAVPSIADRSVSLIDPGLG